MLLVVLDTMTDVNPTAENTAPVREKGGADLANCAELFLLLPMKKRRRAYTFHRLTYLSTLFFKCCHGSLISHERNKLVIHMILKILW